MQLVACAYPGGELPLLRSPVLAGFAHGFTTRAGGVSPPPYASLNLAMAWGDARDNVFENRRRLLAACGAQRLHLTRQVHGAAVAVIGDDSPPELPPQTEADALVTSVPGAAVAVFTADCVPLLIGDVATGAVAAVHAGWRGVIAGVAPAAIAALARAHGSRPADLRVALGPAIAACCFEVGAEVADAFTTTFRGVAALVRTGPAGKPHVDLKAALIAQLGAAGITRAQIDAGEECTRCDPARFYSYRRDAKATGQHLSVIVPRG